MAVTDPADARLLAALADMGKAAVHEVAAQVGMDPKEAAYRLVNLSATGLPLLVGVESDPSGLRSALSDATPWAGGQTGQAAQHATPTQPPQQQPAQPQRQHPAPQTGPEQARGVPSGPYPAPPNTPPSAYGTPSGPYSPPAPPSPPAAGAAGPPGGTPMPPGQQSPPPQHGAQQQAGRAQTPPAASPPQPASADPMLSTWGPPQTAGWTRRDQPTPQQGTTATAAQQGRVGDTLESTGLEGESLAIQLLEVQDPADFLFGAAGYQLAENERAVVVHTEFTNRGRIPFASLPDNYLELVTAEGRTIAKDPMSLTSRPPHKIGLQPGETAGGHTLYVLPGETRVVAVRWSPRPEADDRARTWSIED